MLYYQDSLTTIYHADCNDLDIQSDVVLLDPPFHLWRDAKKWEASSILAFTTFQYRHFVHNLYGIPRFELVWYFTDGRWVSHTLPRNTHETILLFGKSNSVYVGEKTDGISHYKGNGGVGKDKLAPRTYIPRERKSLNSVLPIPRAFNKSNLGVWGKPENLISQLIEWVAFPNSIILDPYLGSGTTCVVAKKLGFKSIGIEKDEQRCEIAAKRLENI